MQSFARARHVSRVIKCCSYHSDQVLIVTRKSYFTGHLIVSPAPRLLVLLTLSSTQTIKRDGICHCMHTSLPILPYTAVNVERNAVVNRASRAPEPVVCRKNTKYSFICLMNLVLHGDLHEVMQRKYMLINFRLDRNCHCFLLEPSTPPTRICLLSFRGTARAKWLPRLAQSQPQVTRADSSTNQKWWDFNVSVWGNLCLKALQHWHKMPFGWESPRHLEISVLWREIRTQIPLNWESKNETKKHNDQGPEKRKKLVFQTNNLPHETRSQHNLEQPGLKGQVFTPHISLQCVPCAFWANAPPPVWPVTSRIEQRVLILARRY